MASLELSDVQVGYGKTKVLRGINISVPEGSIVCLLGANGAGKTTLMHTIAGLLKPETGSVTVGGKNVSGIDPDRVVAHGVALVPQGRQLFARMTVRDNLFLGSFLRRDFAAIEADVERMFSLFPILKRRFFQPAMTLSGGEQQMLAIARALMSAPKLLLLDEPSLGLAPLIVRQIYDVIADVNRQGLTVFVVEQNAAIALKVARHAYVMETGRVVIEGTGESLISDRRVQEAYLGVVLIEERR
jgi:branched-chain amino acid transport system ATP-binding protein